MQNRRRQNTFDRLANRFFGGRSGIWFNRGGLITLVVGVVFLAGVYLHWFVTGLFSLAGILLLFRFILNPIYVEWGQYHRKTDSEMNMEIVETFGAVAVLFGLSLLAFAPMWMMIALAAGLAAAALLVFCLGTLPAFFHMRKRIEESRKW